MRIALGYTNVFYDFIRLFPSKYRAHCCRSVCFQQSNTEGFRYGKFSTVDARKRTDANVRRFSFLHSSGWSGEICVIFAYHSKQ